MNESELTAMQLEFKMLEECALIYLAMEPEDET
jgi:hypothetical protein